jgi:hypothetical protein
MCMGISKIREKDLGVGSAFNTYVHRPDRVVWVWLAYTVKVFRSWENAPTRGLGNPNVGLLPGSESN